jgi:2-dehydro-3-deoxyphosphogluconate aldolase/(4S)-4-hydroxy-2-oxoglutarate aldolase
MKLGTGMNIDSVMRMAPVIPVLTIEPGLDPAQLAETLVTAGLPAIEVTLRTPGALDAIRAMAAVEGAVVGAGTVLNEAQLAQAIDAGAQFIVSPGLTNPLALAARDTAIPFLPGVATASELMRGLDLGLERFKFFPAEAAGGLPALKALAAPFGNVRFCPTGGITEQSAPEWLAHSSVLCVGGSWIVPKGETDLGTIGDRARAAAAIRESAP